MLINMLVVASIISMSADELHSKEDVVFHFVSKPIWFGDYLIEELGDIMVVEWDVTKNGYADLVVTCENCFEKVAKQPYDFRIYENNNDKTYRRLDYGFGFPMDLLLIKDEQGTLRLATPGPFSRDRNAFPILAVEQEGDTRWEMEIILWVNSETTEEELAWLQEGRQAAQSSTTIYSEEDIAALKARRNADATTHVSPQPLPPPPSDNAATPALETLPRDNAITERFPQDDASTADESVGFIDGEDREDYSAETRLWILVIGVALLFIVGLSAIFVYRRKHTM